MKIDKSRFLVLTASLASASAAVAVSSVGCSTTSTSTDAGGTSTTDGGDDSDADVTGDGGDQADADAAACLGDNGSAPSCGSPVEEGADGGADDAGAVAKCPAECTQAATYFKKDVARAVNDCLELGPTCEGAVAGCLEQVIPNACPDTTAADFCTPIIEGCSADAAPQVDLAMCTTFVTALNADGRASLQSCVDESGCDFLGSCFISLGYPAVE